MQVTFNLGWQQYAIDGVDAKEIPGILELFKRIRRVDSVKTAKADDPEDYEYVNVLKFGTTVKEFAILVGNTIEPESKVKKFKEPDSE